MKDQARAVYASAPLQGRSRARKPRPCPCCGTPGGLCAAHKERLAPLKAVVNPGTDALTKLTVGKGRSKPGKRRRTPTCCRPDCGEPRVPPDAFCWEHENEATE